MHGMDNFKMQGVIYTYYLYSQAQSSTFHSLTELTLQAVKYGALLEHGISKSEYILMFGLVWFGLVCFFIHSVTYVTLDMSITDYSLQHIL
jgi:hypothetical protein